MHYGQPLGSMRALERDLYHGQFCHDNQFTWEEADTWHQHQQQPGPAIMREALPPVAFTHQHQQQWVTTASIYFLDFLFLFLNDQATIA